MRAVEAVLGDGTVPGPVYFDTAPAGEGARLPIDQLTKTAMVAAVRAARRLEVTAERIGYWAARGAANDPDTKRAAAQLGLNEDATRKLLARPYR
ncbi:hypothetical protein ACIA8F_24145 [Streptomyces sp. NPDC051563]|uniref:hypothetical protein n=1 Tax=Streptomyces sp. NPDC051563 TaxID=3365659 RepID=UPI0037B9527A